jgi:hypothetical protein
MTTRMKKRPKPGSTMTFAQAQAWNKLRPKAGKDSLAHIRKTTNWGAFSVKPEKSLLNPQHPAGNLP